MILAVSGWRDWTDFDFAVRTLRPYVNRYQKDLHIRVGNARGLDKIIRKLLLPTNRFGITCAVYEADWSIGRGGGMVRNIDMLLGRNSVNDPTAGLRADRLLAFPQPFVAWRVPGSGTVGCMIEAFKLGIRIDVPGYTGQQLDKEMEERL